MIESLKTFLLGFALAIVIFGAHELVTMNDQHWCQIEYKDQPRYVAQCTVIGKGLARVSFK